MYLDSQNASGKVWLLNKESLELGGILAWIENGFTDGKQSKNEWGGFTTGLCFHFRFLASVVFDFQSRAHHPKLRGLGHLGLCILCCQSMEFSFPWLHDYESTSINQKRHVTPVYVILHLNYSL